MIKKRQGRDMGTKDQDMDFRKEDYGRHQFFGFLSYDMEREEAVGERKDCFFRWKGVAVRGRFLDDLEESLPSLKEQQRNAGLRTGC